METKMLTLFNGRNFLLRSLFLLPITKDCAVISSDLQSKLMTTIDK